MPGAFVSNTTERSANASVVSASLALAAYPDEDDELELLDDELVEDELLEDELLEEELLDAAPLEEEVLDDEPEVPPHPLSTMAKAASAKFKDFIFSLQTAFVRIGGLSLCTGWLTISVSLCNSHPLHPASGGKINHFPINSDSAWPPPYQPHFLLKLFAVTQQAKIKNTTSNGILVCNKFCYQFAVLGGRHQCVR